MEAGRRRDSRDPLMNSSLEEIEETLDPQLASLGGMLLDMADQITPEYGYLSPPPARDHLHEAMRRLLLEQIVRMDEDIELRPIVRIDTRFNNEQSN